MNIHKKILMITALGMLLITAIVVFSLHNVMSSISSQAADMEQTTTDRQKIAQVAEHMDAMAGYVHKFISTKTEKAGPGYTLPREQARALIAEMEKSAVSPAEQTIIQTLKSDLALLEIKADTVFGFSAPRTGDHGPALALIVEIDSLIAWMHKDIREHFQQEQKLRIARFEGELSGIKRRVFFLVGTIIVFSFGFLLLFGIFIHRKVAVPLNDLWKGATQISEGDLDYRLKLEGSGDIGQLASRFNALAQQLRQSYSELEKKLLERTNELAAIDSVALTMSQSGNLRGMLAKSLDRVLNSLAALSPRGGIFLREPDGEHLTLMASQGLSPEFVSRESTICMGECLCGLAAQNGEMIYSEKSCEDPRHTRGDHSTDHSHIIVPIKSRGIVLGVIFLYLKSEIMLKPSDLQMLDTIGMQLGLAVENLRFWAEVKESSEKFWDLFENSRDILFTMDNTGTLTAVNRAAEMFSGYPKNELVGKNVADFLTPEGRETAAGLMREEGPSAPQMAEFEVIRRDGSSAVVEMSARKLWKNRVHTGFQVSARDITEQKEMRQRLLSAERLGAIGQVVITVRHEINNPLTTVIGNVELLLERYGDTDKDFKKRLETILNNSLRIAEIVQKLQEIKRDKVVEYVNGLSMTDLKQE